METVKYQWKNDFEHVYSAQEEEGKVDHVAKNPLVTEKMRLDGLENVELFLKAAVCS